MGRFIYINDQVPEVTTGLLRSACAQRNVDFVEVDAPVFPFAADAGLQRGDMLYRAGISPIAQRAEAFLFEDGVASFHTDSSAFWHTPDPLMLFRCRGLPIPRTIPLAERGAHLLPAHVEAAGGFPVVVKIP